MYWATSIDVRLSDEIGEGGAEILEKPDFIIIIRYKIPPFMSVLTFLRKGERVTKNFGKKLKF